MIVARQPSDRSVQVGEGAAWLMRHEARHDFGLIP
jgi:hypothetical protein